MGKALIVRAKPSNIPMLRDRYPFLYLEHGRLEIDDASIKWISADGKHIRLPIATISTLLLGPGTSVTHEAVKILASLNTTVCWVGEDSLLFYAVGSAPTANTYHLKQQITLATHPEKSLNIARRMFSRRFPSIDVSKRSLSDLMTLEGQRVKNLYQTLAKKYHVAWHGRSYIPGKFDQGDPINKLITASNAALYALVCSITYSLGYDPRIGFVHSGSPLPFVYDIADLYKEDLVFDLAFSLIARLNGRYDRLAAFEGFKDRVLDSNFMSRCPQDILNLMEAKP